MTEQEEILQLRQWNEEMMDALDECADWFDSRSDVVDGDYGGQLPNAEMQMLQLIERALKGRRS